MKFKMLCAFILLCCLVFFAELFLSSLAKADVVVGIVVSQKPTSQFEDFVAEFIFALSQRFQEADPAVGRKAAGVEMRPFFLVEQRDGKKPWIVGLCKLKSEIRQTSRYAFSATFHHIWKVKGKRLKNREKIRELAREAAEFLFNYLQKEGA